MAVIAPQLTPLPPPPLPTDAEADFDAKAGASLTAQVGMVVEINASLTWIATQVNAAEGYAVTASQAAMSAGDSAEAAGVSLAATQALAAALGDDAGLPSLAGNARRALAVLPNELGVSFQSQIKALYIEPLVKADATGAYALDTGVSGVFDLALTGNTSFSFSNIPPLSSAEMIVVLLRITSGATAFSMTLPAGIVWLTSASAAPAAPAVNSKIEILLTFEGGLVYGRMGGGT